MRRHLTLRERQTLGQLSGRGSFTLRELANGAAVNPSTMSARITRLRRFGLVTPANGLSRTIRIAADVGANSSGSLVAWVAALYPYREVGL